MGSAEFKALLEHFGYTTTEYARELQVNERTIRRWTTRELPPPSATARLHAYLELQVKHIQTTLDALDSHAETYGTDPQTITLTRYRNAASCAAAGVELPFKVHSRIVTGVYVAVLAAGYRAELLYAPSELDRR